MSLKDLENRRKFGKLVGQKRKAQGLTQKELARKVGISISLMQMIEQGKAGPGHRGMFAIAELLRIPFDPESIATKSKERRLMEGMEEVKKEMAVIKNHLGQLNETVQAMSEKLGPGAADNPEDPPDTLGRVIGEVDKLRGDVAALKKAQEEKGMDLDPEDPETPEDAVSELVQQYTGAGEGDGFGLLDSLFGSKEKEKLESDAYVDASHLCEHFEVDPDTKASNGFIFDDGLNIADKIKKALVDHATGEEPDAEKSEDKILEILSKHLPKTDSRRGRWEGPGRTGRREVDEEEED